MGQIVVMGEKQAYKKKDTSLNKTWTTEKKMAVKAPKFSSTNVVLEKKSKFL